MNCSMNLDWFWVLQHTALKLQFLDASTPNDLNQHCHFFSSSSSVYCNRLAKYIEKKFQFVKHVKHDL